MEAYTGRGLYSNHRSKNDAPEKYSPPKFEDRKLQITPKSVKELTTIHFDKPKGISNNSREAPTIKLCPKQGSPLGPPGPWFKTVELRSSYPQKLF